MTLSLPKEKVTVVEMLRCFFGDDLDRIDLETLFERAPEKFLQLYDFYKAYLDAHSDFVISPKPAGSLRPFFWGAIGNGGDFTGGTPAHVVKQAILLYRSILITEPLHLRLTQLSPVDWQNDIYQPKDLRHQFYEYLKFLSHIAPLVDAGIVNIASDRSVYRFVRTGSTTHQDRRANRNWHDRFKDLEVEAFLGSRAQSVREDEYQIGSLYNQYDMILGYFDIIDQYDADIATNNMRNEWLVQHLFEYWRVENERNDLVALSTRHTLNLDLTETVITDLVAVRRNEQVFEDFRSGLEKAYQLHDARGFRHAIKKIADGVNTKPKSVWASPAKNTLFTAVGATIDLTVGPRYGLPPLTGTGASYSLSLLGDVFERALSADKAAAQRAIGSLCTGILVDYGRR